MGGSGSCRCCRTKNRKPKTQNSISARRAGITPTGRAWSIPRGSRAPTASPSWPPCLPRWRSTSPFTGPSIPITPGAGWRRWRIAPDFRFTAKVWQVFTHERRLPEAELAQFREGLAPLLAGGKLGVLLAQFPYSFHNTEENRALSGAASKPPYKIFPWPWRCATAPGSSGPCGSFSRAGRPGFLQHRPADGLLPHGRHPVGHRQPGLPALPRTAARMPGLSSGRTGAPGMTTCTPPKNWRIWRPGPGSWLAKAAETYVIFNNHPAGQAVANALELIHLLNPVRQVSVPPALLAAFPRLAESVMK